MSEGGAPGWLAERVRELAAKIARTRAEVGTDPLGSVLNLARGMTVNALEGDTALVKQALPAGRVLEPFLRRGIDQYADPSRAKESIFPEVAALERSDAQMRQGKSDVQDLGELVGIPQPGGGQVGAARQVFKHVNPSSVAEYEHLVKLGYSPQEIWRKVQLARFGEHVVEMSPTDNFKLLRQWRPGETRARFGDLFQAPAQEAELEKAIVDLPSLPVTRAPGSSGSITLGRRGSTGTGPIIPTAMRVGDSDMLGIAKHEIMHGLDSLGGGFPAGASLGAMAQQVAQETLGQPFGINELRILAMRGYKGADEALHEALRRYYREPGEQLARIASGHGALPDAMRRVEYPFSVVRGSERTATYKYDDAAKFLNNRFPGENMLPDLSRSTRQPIGTAVTRESQRDYLRELYDSLIEGTR